MKRTKFAIESEKYAKENPFVEKEKTHEQPNPSGTLAAQLNWWKAENDRLQDENEAFRAFLKEMCDKDGFDSWRDAARANALLAKYGEGK